MSTSSRLRSTKRPAVNARKVVKAQAATRGTVINGKGESVPAPFNATPGHRDLGLIPKPRTARGVRFSPDSGSAKGAFGGVTKTERKRRQAALVA
jgi:hypothetical protein